MKKANPKLQCDTHNCPNQKQYEDDDVCSWCQERIDKEQEELLR